jgi:nitrite reductase/ring-hydroxylating ferredoxin subunit
MARMGLLRTLLLGRPAGFRSKVLVGLGLKKPCTGKREPGADSASQSGNSTNTSAIPHEPAEKSLRLKKEPPRDVTPPEGYEVVLHKDALEPGQIIEVIIGGTAIAVARIKEDASRYYAISNKCPHADGPLGEGSLDGTTVTCPYHGWQFDVSTGACKTNPYAQVQNYPVQVVGDAVCVQL